MYPLIITLSHKIKIVIQDKGTNAIFLGIRTHKNYLGKYAGICIFSVNKQKEQYTYRKYMLYNINKHQHTEYKQSRGYMSENAGTKDTLTKVSNKPQFLRFIDIF